VWNQLIRCFPKSIGFETIYSASCVSKETGVIIAMWLDDLMIFGKDMESIEDLTARCHDIAIRSRYVVHVSI